MAKALYFGLDPSHYQKTSPYEVIHLPLIRIVPRSFEDPSIQQALACFDLVSHVLLTSRSAVFWWNQYLSQYAYPATRWVKKTLLAIGPATEKALEDLPNPWKRQATHKPEVETSEGICALLGELSPAPSLLLWPHSALSRSLIIECLEKRQIPYQAPILYETLPQQPAPLPLLEDFQELVFSSPSTIDAFLQLYPYFPDGLKLVTIGPTTEKHLSFVLKLYFQSKILQ